jgi:RND family efflux transporter MFP subunit
MKPVVKRVAAGTGFAGAAALVVLYVAGAFETGRVAPGRAPGPEGLPAPARVAQAVRGEVPLFEEAVGTVRSRARVAVAAQIPGRILSISVNAGAAVKTSELLVVLDDHEAAARFAQAKAHYERTKGFLAQQAATTAQMEVAESDYLQAKAALEHTKIVAPLDGVVSERLAEPGDLAWPGRTLLALHDPRALRLEAQVRESLVSRVKKGAALPVDLPGTGRVVDGTVAEVIPSADPQSRSFVVWVNFEPLEGVYPGMYGRLRIPVGRREVVQVPATAVVRVGQLETVLAKEDDGRWARRLVTTGARLDGGAVEVLSGLAGGETVGTAE